jgi:hypothetical protein
MQMRLSRGRLRQNANFKRSPTVVNESEKSEIFTIHAHGLEVHEEEKISSISLTSGSCHIDMSLFATLA